MRLKIKSGFILQDMAGSYAVVPTEQALQSFNGIAFLNKTGYDIWKGLEQAQSSDAIAAALVEKYDGVTKDEALRYVTQLIEKLRTQGLLED